VNTKKIGVGIVGLSAKGGWAATAHVPALRALSDDCEIVGLSASSMASAKEASEKHGVAFYTDDPAQLAARPDVDLLVITVKVPYHRELTEAAINAGKAVYCEWPLGNGLAEAEALAALAEARGVKTFVGLQARSAPEIRFLKDMIAKGGIGDVLSTSVIGSGGPPWGGVATSGSVYATDRSTGATMLTIPFGHTIDGLSWVLGAFADYSATIATRRPDVALSDTGGTARATGPDQIAFNGVLDNGIVVSMHYRGGFSRGTNFLWEINGTKGDIVVSGGIGHLQFGLIKLQAATGEDKALGDLAVPNEYITAPVGPGGMSYTVAHAYRAVFDDIRQGTAVVPDFAEAVALHRLLDKIDPR
jgi:predicted dehydrogenase